MQHFQAAGIFGFLVLGKAGPETYGNIGQANHFAVYTTMALAGALYLYGRGRLPVAAMAACAALLLPALALTGSRSIWLYLGTLAVLAVLLWRCHRDADSRRLAVAALCLLPGFLVANWLVRLSFAAPPPATAPMVTSAERIFDVARGASIRLQLWKEAWDLFLEAPLLGAGTGRFAWHHFLSLAGLGTVADTRVFNHAHNLFMHLLAETGLAGALAVTGPLAVWAVKLKRARLDLELTWLLALLGVVGILSLLEHPLWYAYFLGMTALLLGMSSEGNFELRHSAVARAVAAAGIVVGLLNLVSVLAPYRDFERLVFVPGRGAPAHDDAAFAQVLTRVYREPLLVPYVEFALALGIEPGKDRLPEKLALVGRAARFAPTAHVTYQHALLLALAGEGEAARLQLERSMRVYPRELAEVRAQLADLARRYPREMAPLTEAAARRPGQP
jgi:hypothetical protein